MAGIRDSISRLRARVRTASIRGPFDTRARARQVAQRGGAHPKSFGPTNLIQNAILNRRLADRYQMKEFAPIPTMATELQPVVVVDDMTLADREDSQILGISSFAGSSPAAQINVYQFTNPSTDILARLRYAILAHNHNSAAAQWIIGKSTNIVVSPGQGQIQNTRTPFPGALTACRFGYLSQIPPNPGTSLQYQFWHQPFTQPYVLDLSGSVVEPGGIFSLNNLTQNMSTSVTLAWIEEPLSR